MIIKSFELSDENESTLAPYWIIIDISQNILSGKDYGIVSSFIKGIFFSRESAKKYLEENKHHFSKNAVVYCMSGYGTDWGELIEISKKGVNNED